MWECSWPQALNMNIQHPKDYRRFQQNTDQWLHYLKKKSKAFLSANAHIWFTFWGGQTYKPPCDLAFKCQPISIWTLHKGLHEQSLCHSSTWIKEISLEVLFRSDITISNIKETSLEYRRNVHLNGESYTVFSLFQAFQLYITSLQSGKTDSVKNKVWFKKKCKISGE